MGEGELKDMCQFPEGRVCGCVTRCDNMFDIIFGQSSLFNKV